MNFLFWFINCIIAVIVMYLKYRLSRRKLYEVSDMIPGPVTYPIIGSMYLFFGKDNEGVLKVVDDLLDTYSSPAKAWFGPMLVLLIDSPVDLKVVLNSPNSMQKAYPYSFLGVSKGLMAAPAEMWKMHRKYLNPCFNPKLLQSFLPIFNTKSRIMVNRMQCKLDKDEFDVYSFIGKCTLDMICGTAMGLECDFQNESGDNYLESAERIAENVNRRVFNIFLHPLICYKFTKLFRDEQQAWKGMRAVSAKVIQNFQKRKSQRTVTTDENNNPVEKHTSELRRPKLFVEQVFEMRKVLKEFDQQSLQDEIDTLIAGGNETSALTVSFVLLMLAMHQDVQERVVQEIVSVFGHGDLDITTEEILKLDYLTMVINESLRLFPITPLIGREIMKDIQLEKFTLPAGSSIVIPIYKVHRNVDTWGPNSNLFDPDNFLPVNVEKRHPYSYLPFSNGPRNCIGMKYSLLAMKTMLCHLLRSYKFTTSLKYSELRFKMCLDLKISNKHMVRIERRKL